MKYKTLMNNCFLCCLLLLMGISSAVRSQPSADSDFFIKVVASQKKIVILNQIGEYTIAELDTAVYKSQFVINQGKLNKQDSSVIEKYEREKTNVPTSESGIFESDKIPFDPETIILTDAEKKYLFSQLNVMKQHQWTKANFANATIVTQKNTDEVFKNKRGSLSDGWSNFHKKYGAGYFTFSKPVFFRDNTMCVFYESYSCGVKCGQGDLSIYLKKGNLWEKVAILYSWIS